MEPTHWAPHLVMQAKHPALPSTSGISLKAQHYQQIIETLPDIGWFEVHPENYMCEGGPPHRYLTKIRENYPLSLHGVGMSLGSDISEQHLKALSVLIERYQPQQVSEHIAWSQHGGAFFNDLLPLPYSKESFSCVSDNIDKAQNYLKRSILVENPSSYVGFSENDFSEPDFLNTLCKKTSCGLLLDINNVFVSGSNNGIDPYRYLDEINPDYVGEIHLAGHSIVTLANGTPMRIDDHGSAVKKEVWQLLSYFIEKHQQRFPCLIEWDSDIPELQTLLGEAHKASKRIKLALEKNAPR
ncbi:hypothetical protein SAMN02745866_02833 [Alteromonadaceae bacterium Bs31]|nr:hypothetical protein SAMN02745866_02833 [Alteromonadaceae bacterium Bs31]